jgi:hypothetical protein
MSREASLIQDPNSLFAISRALRKQIVRTDPNPQNRNDAIRDEKHIAYKSTGKGTIETFKYDILTSLEQLDNMFLELETVVPRITNEPAGRVGRPSGSRNKPKAKGAGYYRGGALPPLPSNEDVFDALRYSLQLDTVSDTLKDILKFYIPRAEEQKKAFETGKITSTEFSNNIYDLFKQINGRPALMQDIASTDERDALADIDTAVQDYIKTLTETKKRTVLIPPTAGNEFVVSALSKINVLLIKLIAEYNGKILANYKNFLQSDLQEIANKVSDSLARFRDLQDNVLKDFSQGAKAADIDKFVSTIDQNFKRLTALVNRSIANFVNPNITLLPNFSQQLVGESFQDPKQPFNLYKMTEVQKKQDIDTKIDKLVKQYIPIREDIQKNMREFNAVRNTIEGIDQRIEFLDLKKMDGSISKREKLALLVLDKDREKQLKQMDKLANRLDKLQYKRNAIEDMPEFAFFPRGVA